MEYRLKYDSIEHNPKARLTIVLSCFGDMNFVEAKLEHTVNQLAVSKENIELLVVTDGAAFLERAVMKRIQNNFPYVKVLSLAEETHKPAAVTNIALSQINTQYVAFAWAGSHFDPLIADFAESFNRTQPVYTIKSFVTSKVMTEPSPSLVYGWLQCTKLYELSNIIVSKKALITVGQFDESSFLQRDFDWEWILRLARNFSFTQLGTVSGENDLSLKSYPYNKYYEFDSDLIHRYVVRNRPLNYEADDMHKTEIYFNKDLPHYKVTIIGGYWEYHHNQLGFFNYFDKMYGKGFATYKVLLDFLAQPEDVLCSDLVIITRSRHPKILNILDTCEEEKIPTLYMIDDNWITIAEDLPEVYGQLFAKGNPQFITFIEAITRCSAVITYNKNLYEDINKYNKNTILFPLNINLDFYKNKRNDNLHKPDEIVVGYAGSVRHDNTAFLALANVAKMKDNVKIMLFGNFEDDQMKLFEGLNTIILNHVPYPIYCKQIMEVSPDILLAPLIDNKTSKSKCPNKYIEAGAVFAAGVYSNITPYKDIVTDGKDGMLVDGNTQKSWEEKILLLVHDKKMLKRVKKQCHKKVRKHYSTKRLLEKFCGMIEDVIKGGDKYD